MSVFRIPSGVLSLMKRLTDAGYEANLVGGCVRDLMRGVLPHDYDLTTSAFPDEMKLVFSDLRVIETGIKHGTLTVLLGGEAYEITTYRIDGEYTDSRHPDGVTFTRTLREDLARRDFTVNAMAYSADGTLTDPFGGRDDLDARLLRAVGDPKQRFAEDALRILRALRFSATLGFSIEDQTADAARRLAAGVRSVSAERIREEFVKLLAGSCANRVLSEFRDLLATALPPLPQGTAWEIPELPSDSCRLAAFLRGCEPQEAEQFLLALRFDRKTVLRVKQAVAIAKEPIPTSRTEMLRCLRRWGGEEAICDRLALAGDEPGAGEAQGVLSAIKAENACYTVGALAVRGDDLCARGIPPGPELGQLLSVLLDEVIDGTVENERNALLARAEEIRKNRA